MIQDHDQTVPAGRQRALRRGRHHTPARAVYLRRSNIVELAERLGRCGRFGRFGHRGQRGRRRGGSHRRP